jgi:hypothetical protein
MNAACSRGVVSSWILLRERGVRLTCLRAPEMKSQSRPRLCCSGLLEAPPARATTIARRNRDHFAKMVGVFRRSSRVPPLRRLGEWVPHERHLGCDLSEAAADCRTQAQSMPHGPRARHQSS